VLHQVGGIVRYNIRKLKIGFEDSITPENY